MPGLGRGLGKQWTNSAIIGSQTKKMTRESEIFDLSRDQSCDLSQTLIKEFFLIYLFDKEL